MNILALFFQNPLPPCFTDLEGRIAKIDVFRVFHNLPRSIDLLLHGKEFLAEVEVDSNLFRGVERLSSCEAAVNMILELSFEQVSDFVPLKEHGNRVFAVGKNNKKLFCLASLHGRDAKQWSVVVVELSLAADGERLHGRIVWWWFD